MFDCYWNRLSDELRQEADGLDSNRVRSALSVVLQPGTSTERFKRKVMLMVGVLGVVACLIVIGTVYLMNLDKKVTD